MADTNYTISYDSTMPNITLIEPFPSDETSNSASKTFYYNVSDSNLANCSLIINNVINLTNSSINQSSTQSFTQTFSPATYTWQINCTDKAGNQKNSSQKSFTITAPVQTTFSGSSGGGGGGKITTYKVYTITPQQASEGYTKILNKNDKIKFTFFDEKSEEHTLTINEIGKNYVKLTISSTSINLTLGIGQSIKLNLTSADYYDLYIKLNSILQNKVEITIQTIHEKILKQSITIGQVVEEKKAEEKINEKNKKKEEKAEVMKNLEIVIAVLVIIIVILMLLIKEIVKEKIIRRKKKFKKQIKRKKNFKRGKKRKQKFNFFKINIKRS